MVGPARRVSPLERLFVHADGLDGASCGKVPLGQVAPAIERDGVVRTELDLHLLEGLLLYADGLRETTGTPVRGSQVVADSECVGMVSSELGLHARERLFMKANSV